MDIQSKTHLIKEVFLLVIVDTGFWPVFKQVPLAFIQQHLCKFNLESPRRGKKKALQRTRTQKCA